MFRPTEAFSWGQRMFDPATEVAADDPAVTKFPHLFEQVAPEPPVERATARPGERRTTRRPKAKPVPEVEAD